MIDFLDGIISKVKNYKYDIVVCGCSSRTVEVLENKQIKSKVNYIFDNNQKMIANKFCEKEVIGITTLKSLNKPLFLIWGNHSISIFEQLRKESLNNILIEFSPKLADILGNDFYFQIEVPDYQSSHGLDVSHEFIPKLVQSLLRFNRPLKTIPTKHNNDNYFRKREVKDNSFLFAYHTYGTKSDSIVYFKEGYLPDLINIDSMGYSGWSSLCSDKKELENINDINLEEADNHFTNYKNKYINKNISKYQQPEIDNCFVFPEEFAFFPLQVFNDSVMELSYFNPLELLNNLIKLFIKEKKYLLIKRHPRCNIKEVRNILDKHKNNPYITEYSGSIHMAIEKCEVVYTINSGVGFESLFHLKPVITFGKSDYQSATFNITSLKEIEASMFFKLDERDKNYIKKFVYFYLKKKNIFINNKQSINSFIENNLIKIMNNKLKG